MPAGADGCLGKVELFQTNFVNVHLMKQEEELLLMMVGFFSALLCGNLPRCFPVTKAGMAVMLTLMQDTAPFSSSPFSFCLTLPLSPLPLLFSIC